MFPTSVLVGPQALAHPACVRSRASLRRGETSTSGRSPPLQALKSHEGGGVRRWRVKSAKPCAEEAQVSEGASPKAPKRTQTFVQLDGELVALPERYKSLPEGEQFRRLRISRRNKGTQPWNKGRKHTAETRERIRVKTREAMQRESVKEKCRLHYKSRPKMSKERRAQISASMREAIRARKLKERVENFLDPLPVEEKKKEVEGAVWARKVKKVKTPKAKKQARSPHDPKSEEHRARISEAIRRKWRDPEYQMRQRMGIKRKRLRAAPRKRKTRKPIRDVEQEKKYLEVVKHIKLLQTGIRDLENQRDLLSNDGESVEEIHVILEETTGILSSVLEQVKPIHEELGPKLGVEISFGLKKVEQQPIDT